MKENRKTMMERYVRHIYPNAVFGSFFETVYGATELQFWIDDNYNDDECYFCVVTNGMVSITKVM